MQTRRAFGKMVLMGLGTVAAAPAIDWTQWRGPNQDGVSPEKGLMQDWPAGGAAMAQIRTLVMVNLFLGLVTIAVGALGPLAL